MSKKTHVIYHAGCPDGFGAAWAAHRVLGDRNVRYIPQAYGDPPPRMDAGSRVYILDFSYPRSIMRDLMWKHAPVILMDHHETAQEDIGDLPGCHFDIGHSGAVIAWEHFHPGEPVPQLLSYVEDRDLWKWDLWRSRQVNRALMSYEMDFGTWDGLVYDLPRAGGPREDPPDGHRGREHPAQ